MADDMTTSDMAAAFDRNGFAGPFRLFAPEECGPLLRQLRRRGKVPQIEGRDWDKGWAPQHPAYWRVATDPRLIDMVRPLLGDDIIVWGTHLVRRLPNRVHRFHTDVESRAPEGGFVTAWIGLENVRRESGLIFVRGSHRHGITIQEMNHRAGIARGDSDEAGALELARQLDPAAELVQPEIGDGEVLLFDGRCWHGSQNRTALTRRALLVQFARADRPVRMPAGYMWPITDLATPRPPVLLVSGRAPLGVNAMARPPHGATLEVPNGAWPLPRPVVADRDDGDGDGRDWASVPHFKGRTPMLERIGGHSSVLAPGACPHRPHAHRDEEILVVTHGLAELQIAADADGRDMQRERLVAGDWVYYPAGQHHTLSNVGDGPLHYTMLRWNNATGRHGDMLATQVVRSGERLRDAPGSGKSNKGKILEGATQWLDRLQCHLSVQPPGQGYAPHADGYDVAIVLLAGTIETLGRTIAAPALCYHPAGALHGLRACGATPARYLVFELARAPRNPLKRAIGLAGAVTERLLFVSRKALRRRFGSRARRSN